MNDPDRGSRPWYRQFWVWFVIAPPVATVLFWAVVLTTMARPPSLVVDDYAKVGLVYERDHARDAAAADLGVSGRIHIARDHGGATVVLVGLAQPPDALHLKLAHPTDAARDHELELQRGAGGLYRGDLGRAIDGRRYVEIRPADGEWRLAGEITADRDDLSLTPPGRLAAR